MKTTRTIKNDFNTLAETLGSRARIGGNARKIELQEVIGFSNGYETVVKVDATRFCVLTSKYPQLQN